MKEAAEDVFVGSSAVVFTPQKLLEIGQEESLTCATLVSQLLLRPFPQTFHILRVHIVGLFIHNVSGIRLKLTLT